MARIQAERAAIVTLAALKFKKDYESGMLPTRELYGQPIDTSAYRYLFNVCREPHFGEDMIREHVKENYIVAFSNGHGYKVWLVRDDEEISFEELEDTFEKIIRKSIRPKSWISVLTTDDRDTWAKAIFSIHSS